MTTATICDIWELELPEPAEEAWFLDWVMRSPTQAGKHLKCSWLAYQSLANLYAPEDVTTAREYFGGMGAHALMIQELWSPLEHDVLEFSGDAVAHLNNTLPEGILAWHTDSYLPPNTQAADIVGLDFGDLTVFKAQEGKPHGDLLERVFMLEPKGVVMTDIAARYLHLQKKSYEPLLGKGTCNSYPGYLDAFYAQIRERFGYKRVNTYDNHWSSVTSLVPEDFPMPYLDKQEYFKLDPEDRTGLVLK